MATVHAREVSLSFGAGPVLADVSFTVSPGQRLGVVGPNGTGKSTLLRVVAGLLAPESGSVTCAPPSATIGLLPQEPDRNDNESVADFIGRRTGVGAATTELDAATAALSLGEAGSDDRYSDALDQWLALGGPDLDARIGQTLADLGLDGAIAQQATATLSGGQAARVSLAATLLSRFDVYLLDEPTNDLDFAGLAILEDFLVGLSASTMVVSHDRAFLERVVTHVLDLDEHTHQASVFAGGWSAYQADKVTARRHAEEDYATYQSKKSELTARASTQREWSVQGASKAKASGETDKFVKRWNTSSSEKVAHKAKATERAMERLEQIDKPWEGWELRFEIGLAARSGDVVATLTDAVVDRGTFRLGPVNLAIGWADRVAIIGENGAGKTTLIDALLGRTPLASGDSFVGPGVVIGELSQRRDRFSTDESLFIVISNATGLPANEVRSLLAKFGLTSEHVHKASRLLSPGERTRANLALFMAEGVNCLVLDEPTNHLDLAAIEQLEQALDRFMGTVLLVSHDRAFMDRVRVTRQVSVVAGHVIES